MNIKNSVALVTGANRGLGRAYVQALLDAGVKKVYAAARDPATIDIPRVEPIRLDVTNPVDVAEAARKFTDVDIVINNAGIMRVASIVPVGADPAARAEMETNFFGVLAMSSAFAPILRANGGGALVNMLSVLSWVTLPGVGLYSASKAAAWALTNALRAELRAQGTLVVGVHAGYIDTDMVSTVQAEKTPPSVVAQQVVQAIANGEEEVLADAISRQVKAGLSAQPPVYLVRDAA